MFRVAAARLVKPPLGGTSLSEIRRKKMNRVLDYTCMENEEYEELESISEELHCSHGVAHYVLWLETKLERMNEKLDELWDDYRQR